MRLLLIRHGESAANLEGRMQGQLDSPLTDRGRDQARALLERLEGEDWAPSAVYASDLSRAAETGRILAEGLGLPVVLDARLREYDVGVLTGVVWRQVQEVYPELWQKLQQDDEWVAIPGEEGVDSFHDRLAAFVSDVVAGHGKGETVALVGHGGSLGMILAHLLHMDPHRPMPFDLGNTSLSVVKIDGRRLRLTLLNDTCHLHGRLR